MSSKLATGGQATNVAQSCWELMGKANLSAESFGVGNSKRHIQLPRRHARVYIPGPSPEGPQGKDNGGQGLLGVPPGLGSRGWWAIGRNSDGSNPTAAHTWMERRTYSCRTLGIAPPLGRAL